MTSRYYSVLMGHGHKILYLVYELTGIYCATLCSSVYLGYGVGGTHVLRLLLQGNNCTGTSTVVLVDTCPK